jgi:NAD(P)-dependent dehydrogenase (short-subunit alcohol dehydrogenase family)
MSADQMRLDGRAIVVAGAGGGGIGTATCRAIAGAGGTVVALDLSEGGRDVARTALDEFDGEHLVLEADVTDEDSVRAALTDVEGRVGALRGAVNVVGGMRPDHWASLDAPDALAILNDVVQFNLVPPFVVGRAVVASARANGETASLVNLASVSGLLSFPYGAAYGAAKAALVNLTRTMAIEWGRQGVRVNAIAPGSIQVNRTGRPNFDVGSEPVADAVAAAIPLGRRGTGDEVASAALFLLSDMASYINGHTLVVDGGSSIVPAYNDADDLPIFVSDAALRARLLGGS